AKFVNAGITQFQELEYQHNELKKIYEELLNHDQSLTARIKDLASENIHLVRQIEHQEQKNKRLTSSTSAGGGLSLFAELNQANKSEETEKKIAELEQQLTEKEKQLIASETKLLELEARTKNEQRDYLENETQKNA
ncbi:11902_t:CDS:1, partial [Ambispora gerdemannii]